MHVVTASDCERLLDIDDVVAQVRRALEWEREGTITWPAPRNLNIIGDEAGNHYHVKACVLEAIPVAGVRLVSHPGDDDSGGGTRLIVLIDPATTAPVAIVDESWNYGQRTVASIVLAAAAVARPEAATLGLVGTGHLARLSLTYALRLVPALREVRVTSRKPERRAAFAEWAQEQLGVSVTCTESVRDAVSGADLVLTCTSAAAPLVKDAWIQPGAVVAALDPAEVDPALVRAADLLLVDSREQLRSELMECYGEDAPDWVDATFADVLAGAHAGRTDDAQRAVVVSQGLASQDVALAHLAYTRARENAPADTAIAALG